MFPPIYQILTGAPDVVAIVDDRIGAHGEIEQTAGRPYITWQIISLVPDNSLERIPDTDQAQVQINFWHSTEDGVRSLAKAGRAAIEPFAYITGMPIDQREPDTRLYWIAMQADFWLHRD